MQGWERTILDCGAPCCTIIVFLQVCCLLHDTGQMLLCIFILVLIRLDKPTCTGNSRAQTGHSGLAPLLAQAFFPRLTFAPAEAAREKITICHLRGQFWLLHLQFH